MVYMESIGVASHLCVTTCTMTVMHFFVCTRVQLHVLNVAQSIRGGTGAAARTVYAVYSNGLNNLGGKVQSGIMRHFQTLYGHD